MNIEQEIKNLVETLDDAFDSAFEDWSINFTERQFSDFVDTNGASESTSFMFSAIEGAILEEALRRIRNRQEGR